MFKRIYRDVERIDMFYVFFSRILIDFSVNENGVNITKVIQENEKIILI